LGVGRSERFEVELGQDAGMHPMRWALWENEIDRLEQWAAFEKVRLGRVM